MFRLTINGTFIGNFSSPADAMGQVEKWARPFGHPWKIEDPFGRVYAAG